MIGSGSEELAGEELTRRQPLAVDRKTRLITISQMGLALALGFFIFRAISWGITPRIISLSLVGVLLAASVITRWQKEVQMSADLLVIGIAMAAIVAVCTSGGLSNTASGWLLICPCLAGLLSGRESCQKWGCIMFFVMCCLLFAELSGYQWPNLTPQEYQLNQSHTHILAQMLAMILLLFAFVQEFELYEKQHEMKLIDIQRNYSETQETVSQAQKASFAKTRFLMNKNRELRTPISNIIGFSKRLNHRCPDLNQQDRKSLEAIYRHSKALLKSVDEIAEFVNLEETTLQLCWQTFNLSELIAALPKRFDLSHTGATINVQLRQSSNFRMLGDPTRLNQAMSQLLEYCLRIVDNRGAVTLTLEIDTRIEEQAHVVIEIPNHYVAAETIDNMFTIGGLDLESNLDNASNGLGLAIAYRLIEMHEGSLSAEATEHSGLRFHVFLPPSPPSQDISKI